MRYVDGNVVTIAKTQESGTVFSVDGNIIMVLLSNGVIWQGSANEVYLEQKEENDESGSEFNV